jgi:membrane-associated phospholipid phosphatase
MKSVYNPTDYQERLKNSFPSLIIVFAKIISAVFHPLFLLIYAFILLSWSNSYLFGESDFTKVFKNKNNTLLLIWLTIFSVIVPMLTILMMKALGLIKDFVLSEKTDRIGPFIIIGLLYIVIFMNLNNNTSIPGEMRVFSLGATIALFTAFLINLFSKISLHAVGMGGFMVMVILIMARSYAGNEYILVLTLIFSGMVGSSRLILGAHEPIDIYGGFFVGFISQFIALQILYS